VTGDSGRAKRRESDSGMDREESEYIYKAEETNSIARSYQ